MRQTSNLYSKQNSQEPQVIRGGDKKVMKKSLSLIVAAAMTLTTASVAFADNAPALTPQEKFDALKAAGIFNGFPDGSAGLDKEMTRAEFAKVLTLVAGLTPDATAAQYSDVAATHWAAGYIGAATKAGLLNGLGGGKFGPSGKVTTEQIAKVADLFAKVAIDENATVAGDVSAWAKAYVAAAIKAGFIQESSTYKSNAVRETLVNVAYTLAKPADAVLSATAAQTNNGEITVTLNRAATTEEKAAAKFALTSDDVNYTVTAAWAADNKSVVLTSTYLPAGAYSLAVTGLSAINVTIADEVATKIDITATALQQAESQDLNAVVYNQFGKAVDNADVDLTLVDVTTGKNVDTDGDGNFDLSDKDVFAVGDTFVATAVNAVNGLTTTKTFKLAAGSAATSLKFGTVAPLEGDARVNADTDGYTLPYTFVDQYGAAVKLGTKDVVVDGTRIDLSGITFIVSDKDIVTDLHVDSDGVLTFDTGKAGTVVISAINAATGANTSVSITVAAKASVAKLNMSKPSSVVVADEEVKVPYTALDTYGAKIDATGVDISGVKWGSNLDFAPGYPKLNGKGELLFKFAADQEGTAVVYAYANNVEAGHVSLTVKAPAAPVKLNGITGVVTTLTAGAKVDFDQDNITDLDTYNRTNNVAAGEFQVYTGDDSIVDYVGGQLVGVKAGKQTVTVYYTGGAKEDKNAYSFTVTVVSNDDVKSYTVDTIGTVYAPATAEVPGTAKYYKGVSLTGKLSTGKDVAIVQDGTGSNFGYITSSDTSILGVSGKKVFGVAAGTATVTAYDAAGNVVGTQTVTVSEAAPVAKTATFSADEFDITAATTITLNATTGNYFTVVDQYGVNNAPATAYVTSSDKAIATVALVDGNIVVTPVKTGTVTVTYRTSNGTTATTTVVVN
ncbi:S-layer homology domain-containing protein [Paenibacillus albus]|uniref:SLH domain-containing protein n=1 Tax=Paenibacillus albus TaxID=2495582 RepID=A0A3Q8X2Y4_9BACL|nr:S-layer homology domain-containing protein [Paenibacillus albus]AZN38544.1 hypothetical protein EJC50_01800 [Paenibacillus albus]